MDEKQIYKGIAIIVGFVGVIVAMYFAMKYAYISDAGLAISLFGILATFVVVGNFSQVTQIKNDTTTDIANLRTYTSTEIGSIKTDVKGIEEKVTSLNEKLEKVLGDMYDVEEKPRYQIKTDNAKEVRSIVAEYWREQENKYNNLVYELFRRISAPNYTALIESVTLPKGTYSCLIMKKDAKRSIKATARLEGEFVIFRNNKGEVMNDVEKVNNNDYNEFEMYELLQLWMKIRQTSSSSVAMQNIYEQPILK